MQNRRGVDPPPLPSVTVVMATYNGATTMARAVASVQAQTLADWELLIVDDGSTDGSIELATRLASSDPRIRLLRTESNSGGPARPRNVGLGAARGDTICLLDQDDVWDPDKLALQTAKLASGDFGLVYSDALVERRGEETALYSGLWGPMSEGYVSEELLQRCFIPALTAAVPRKVIRDLGEFDEALSGVDDYDYWLRISLAGHAIGYVDRPLATWIVGSGSLSHRHLQQQERLVTCLRGHARRHPEFGELVAGRLQAAEQELWRLHLDRYAQGGRVGEVLRLATTRNRRVQLFRTTASRLRHLSIRSLLRGARRRRAWNRDEWRRSG